MSASYNGGESKVGAARYGPNFSRFYAVFLLENWTKLYVASPPPRAGAPATENPHLHGIVISELYHISVGQIP